MHRVQMEKVRKRWRLYERKAHSINHGFDGGCHGVTISSGVPATNHGSKLLLLAFTAAT